MREPMQAAAARAAGCASDPRSCFGSSHHRLGSDGNRHVRPKFDTLLGIGMRLTGTLTSWKDDRGFGFIAPTHGGAELFVHISALPRDGTRPTVGEKLTYELGRGKNGRPQAVNVQRQATNRVPERVRIRRSEPRKNRSLLTKFIWLVILLALGAFMFDQYQKQLAEPPSQSEPSTSWAEPAIEIQGFKCDGRTYCSQMTSCTEAKFFLRNCPGTQMDGNNDGTPCEQQWCKNPFSK
jgi:cold shock CspA family protein